ATLQPIAPDAAGYDPSSLIDGNGLAAVRLVVRAVDGEADEHVVATPGPCWPAWINRHELLFVSYAGRGTCALAIYDVRTRRTQRKSLGLRHMVAPAPHRDGRRVAVSGWGNVPDESVIFLADLDNLRLDPGPPVTPGRGAQIFPRWIGDDTLLYVELGEDHARLMRWTIGDRQAHEVATLAAPPTVHDAHHILGGVYDPVSPGLQHYAAYLPAHDAIV